MDEARRIAVAWPLYQRTVETDQELIEFAKHGRSVES
jgi:hypothetical protein